jgi:hypothetical protein
MATRAQAHAPKATDVQRDADGLPEPMLLLAPSDGANIAFPFAVVEAQAYPTGQQILEAENQAAVSMACALKMVDRLDELANQVTDTVAQPQDLFSITTQGPLHELWAHWTAKERGVPVFHSTLWSSWNAPSLERATDFMVKLNNVCSCGTGGFSRVRRGSVEERGEGGGSENSLEHRIWSYR